MQTDTSVLKLDTNLIIPNKYQPRKIFDEKGLNTLAESIKNYGIINPILVRKKDDKYEIIAGERRFRAAKQIGLTEVPVIVKNADEQQMAELALIENLERRNLSPIEEAKSYEEIMRIGNQTQESLAKKLGKSQSAVANKIRLLALPIEVQDALANQKISERHARSLINVKDKDKQINLLERIINEKLTVKETEKIINEKEITEDDIKQAIDDIMKSLNLVEESIDDKKEEKEDDNMNNGNFFPNFDNNNGINNNTSLNMMNAQSMNQAPMEAASEMVMPTMNQPMEMQPSLMVPEQPSMPMENNPMPDFGQFGGLPSFDQNFNMNPGMNQMPPEPMAMPNMNQPMEMQPSLMVPEQPSMPMENNSMPNFGQFGEPQMDVQPTMSEPMNPPMVDVPLFNPDVVMPTQEINPAMNQPMMMNPEPQPMPIENTGFDVPVVLPTDDTTTSPVQTEFSSPSVDKLSELQNYLSSNGYTYKVYNNETENCVIIELPRN